MLSQVVLFIWLSVFLICIYKWQFFSVAGISKIVLIAAFLFRIILGCSNFYIWQNVIGHGDSLRYFNDSKLVYATLTEHPYDFLRLVFGYYTNGAPEGLQQYLTGGTVALSVPEYHMVRINTLLNIFSFGNPYGNIILLSFIYYIGLIVLLKTLVKAKLIQSFSNLQQAIILFLPSLVFWSNGLLKEGPTLLLLCIIIIQCLNLEQRFELKRIIWMLVALFFLLLIRDYVLVLILPNLVVWFIVRKTPQSAMRIFLLYSMSIMLILCLSAWFQPRLNIVLWLKSEQHYFLSEPTDPDYNFKPLSGSIEDMLQKVPYAINNVFFRPNIIKSDNLFRIYQSFELMGIWIFLGYCFFKRKRKIVISATLMLMFVFSIELLFAYGLISFDADTLSRYRSIPIFFLLLPALILLNDSKSTKSGEKANSKA